MDTNLNIAATASAAAAGRASPKPFPIPIVADRSMIGPGSQPEDDTLDYLVMPSGMDTYAPPRMPEPEELVGHDGACAALQAVLDALAAHRKARDDAALDASMQQAGKGAGNGAGTRVAFSVHANQRVLLGGLSAADLALVNQVLGEGEVSAHVDDPLAPVHIQESVFAGVWRVVSRTAQGTVDAVEIGPVPAVLLDAAREDALSKGAHAPATAPVPSPGVMNAPAIVTELQDQRSLWRSGDAPHIVNLTLLPLSPEDIGYLDAQLGTGRVRILSRGYGNCRITNARVPNTWRVVYYNSADTVILNAVEVTGMPEVACAACEDLDDSHERLAEVLQWVQTQDR